MKKAAPEDTAFTHNEDKHFAYQMQMVVNSLKQFPQTMLQVARITGIERANVCRYIATLQRQNKAQLIHKGFCPITHFKAGFYSTDEALFKTNGQLSLFADGGALQHG